MVDDVVQLSRGVTAGCWHGLGGCLYVRSFRPLVTTQRIRSNGGR